MHDKFEMLNAIIVQIDKIFDARGTDRAVMLIDIIQRLNALKTGLADEDKRNADKIETLKNQRDAAREPLPEGAVAVGGQTVTVDADGMHTGGGDG